MQTEQPTEKPLRLLFFDVDGVLNTGQFDPVSESLSIDRRCVGYLNQIIHASGCKVVLTSSWRYLCLDSEKYPSAMTLKGFEIMLRTHGVTKDIEIIDHTERDDERLGDNRGEQITKWLEALPPTMPAIESYVVIDDHTDAPTWGHPLVHTNQKTGLTDADVKTALTYLLRPATPSRRADRRTEATRKPARSS